MSFKSIDDLMQHLRDNGIDISDGRQKQQLRNTGYFHGYKGYRFFKNSSRKIPFTTYDEIYATIKYDSNIKSLFYGKVMFIETAVKNIALNRIMVDANSENIQDIYKEVIRGYTNLPVGSSANERNKAQKDKLKLEKSVQDVLLREYGKNNAQIAHFYNKGYNGVPIWALFESLSLGEFAYLLSCLTYDTREHITTDLGMKVEAVDTNRELIYRYLYVLKDLRNAIAHNLVVFDTRFKNAKHSPAMEACLKSEFNLPYVNFGTIGDYLALVCYYLKLLNVTKTEIRAFIREFEKLTDSYISSVSHEVSSVVVHPDLKSRLERIKNSL